jgi:hypothetical protein
MLASTLKIYPWIMSFIAFACIHEPSARAESSAKKPLKLDFDGIAGCYTDISDFRNERTDKTLAHLKSKISGERKAIVNHVKSFQGSQQAKKEGLNGLLIFQPFSYSNELIAGGSALARVTTKIRETKYVIPLPYGMSASGGEYDADIDLSTPDQVIPVTAMTADGALQRTAITEWRTFDGSCAYAEKNFFFADKINAKNSDIFITCLDQSSCVFKISKLKQFREFHLYQLARPNQTRPDFIFAVDPRRSRGDVVRSLHILRSTPKGWEPQYSLDSSECEGGC